MRWTTSSGRPVQIGAAREAHHHRHGGLCRVVQRCEARSDASRDAQRTRRRHLRDEEQDSRVEPGQVVEQAKQST